MPVTDNWVLGWLHDPWSSVTGTRFSLGVNSWPTILTLAECSELSAMFVSARILDGLCPSAAAVSRQEPRSHVCSFPLSSLAGGLLEGGVLWDIVSHGAGWADHPPGPHCFQKHPLWVSAPLTAAGTSQAGIASLDLTLFLRQMCGQRCEY